jgi:hypothetical protein
LAGRKHRVYTFDNAWQEVQRFNAHGGRSEREKRHNTAHQRARETVSTPVSGFSNEKKERGEKM